MVKERRWNLGFLGKEKYPNSLCSLALAWFLLSAFSSAVPRGVCPSSRTLAFSFLVAQMVKNLPAVRDPWVGKIPWRREWLSTSVYLPGECWGLRSLAGHKSIGSHRAKPDWAPKPFSFQPHPAGRGDESHSRCRAHWLRFPLPPKLLGSAASLAAPSPLQSGLVFRTGSLSVSFNVHQAVTLSSRLFILKADAPSRACLTGAGAVTILAKPQLGLAPALLSPQLFGQVIQDHGSCVLAPRAQVPSLCATIYWCVTCLQDGDNNLPILHALFFLTFVFWDN